MTDGVAVIVGAGDGLGAGTAQAFARDGMTVVASRRKQAPLDALVAGIEAEGGRAVGIACDARDEDQVVALFDRIEDEIGPVEMAMFNAGAWHNAPILEMTSRIYRQVWDTAAFAGFLVGREAARRMAPRGQGTILFTGATASVRGGAGFAAFSGAKQALRGLSQSMARELGPKGIHVAHVIVDGQIDTEAVREKFPDRVAALPEDGLMLPAEIGAQFVALHRQTRSAWTFEMDLRPWAEQW